MRCLGVFFAGPGGLGKTGFKKRWFVLKNRVLYYLVEPPALGRKPQLIGLIPIEGVLCDDDEDELEEIKPPKGLTTECLFRIFSEQSHYDESGNWITVQVKSCKLDDEGNLKTGMHNDFVFAAEDEAAKAEWIAALRECKGF